MDSESGFAAKAARGAALVERCRPLVEILTTPGHS
jgi:hypothetical protein